MRKLYTGKAVFKLMERELLKENPNLFEKYNYKDGWFKLHRIFANKYVELYEKGNRLVYRDVHNWIKYAKTIERKYDNGIPFATEAEKIYIEADTGRNNRNNRVWRVAQEEYDESEFYDLYYNAYVELTGQSVMLDDYKRAKKGKLILIARKENKYERVQMGKNDFLDMPIDCYVVYKIFMNYKKLGLTLLKRKEYEDSSAYQKVVEEIKAMWKDYKLYWNKSENFWSHVGVRCE